MFSTYGYHGVTKRAPYKRTSKRAVTVKSSFLNRVRLFSVLTRVCFVTLGRKAVDKFADKRNDSRWKECFCGFLGDFERCQ